MDTIKTQCSPNIQTLEGMYAWFAFSTSNGGNSTPLVLSSWYCLQTSFSSGKLWNTCAHVCQKTKTSNSAIRSMHHIQLEIAQKSIIHGYMNGHYHKKNQIWHDSGLQTFLVKGRYFLQYFIPDHCLKVPALDSNIS